MKLRKKSSWSISRPRPAAASLRLRARKPALGNVWVRPRTAARGWTPGGRAMRTVSPNRASLPIKPERSSAARDTMTPGASAKPRPSRSGWLTRTARATNGVSPIRKVWPSAMCRRLSRSGSTAAPGTPPDVAVASAMLDAPLSVTVPASGKAASTPRTSARCRSPSPPGPEAMARTATASVTRPRRRRAACSAGVNLRPSTETATSPPRMERACEARPCRKASAVEPAAASAATPRARQARKMRKPATPDLSSRRAKVRDRLTRRRAFRPASASAGRRARRGRRRG